MRNAGDGLPRRAVLRLGAGGTGWLLAAGWTAGGLAGCDRFPSLGHKPAPAGPDALAPFHAATVRMADLYDAAITGHDQLAAPLKPLRDDHRAHADALGRLLILPSATPTAAPSATAVPDQPAAVLNALLAAEKVAVREATDACLTAPAWIAGLVASIAACRATHVEALS